MDPYTTSDTPFAAFLRYHSHNVITTQKDKHDRRRTVFVFVEQENTKELEDDFYNNVADVEPRAYHRALKEIYRRLNDK